MRDIYRAILFATEEQLNGVLKESLREVLDNFSAINDGTFIFSKLMKLIEFVEIVVVIFVLLVVTSF